MERNLLGSLEYKKGKNKENQHRVVITGLGVISPTGIGKETFWKSIISGTSGIDRITSFDASTFSSQIAGEVKNFNPSDFIEPKEARRMDRFTQFAVAATKMALEDARIALDSLDRHRFGVVIGSGIGGLSTLEREHTVLLEKGPRRVNPFLVPMMICNLAAGQVSIYFGLKGPNMCVVTACATGNHAIGTAYEIIKYGVADICVAGGTEAAVTPLGLAGFCAMKALSTRNEEPTRASRPFDAERDGFVMGEGAGIVVLEKMESALSRKTHIYAELAGYGMSADAYHITAPDEEGEGPAQAMRAALEEAGISPSEVDYINAHGTATRYNDKIETLAIKKVFGEHAYKLAVSSTKSMTGHLLGAAGGIEAVISTLAVERDLVPPTINYERKDPECDLNYIPNQAVSRKVNVALSNSFGFGGQNAVLVFKKYSK